MKTLTFKSNLIIAFALVLFLAGCKGDQGDPGPAGTAGTNGTNGTNGKDGVNGKDGTNGTNGTNGTDGTDGTNGTNGTDGTNGADGLNGADGANGVGFDDAIKYGNIVINLEGTRPDDIPFTKSLNFKFSSSNVAGSSAYDYDDSQSEAFENSFNLTRFLTFDNTDTHTEYYDGTNYSYENENATDGSSHVWYDFGSYYNGEGYSDYTNFQLNLKASITTSDFKYFNMNDTYGYYDPAGNYPSNLSDFIVSNYSYTPSTGKVKFKFSGTIDGQYNSTGYELKISGEVNATVFQDISNRGRKGTSGRTTAFKQVPKAVMLDLPH